MRKWKNESGREEEEGRGQEKGGGKEGEGDNSLNFICNYQVCELF